MVSFLDLVSMVPTPADSQTIHAYAPYEHIIVITII